MVGLALSVAACGVDAASLELPNRGLKEMSLAYGGSAALLEDASAVANNPAGLLRLEGRQLSGGATLIHSEFRYDVAVQRELITEVGGQVPGEDRGTISGAWIAPYGYYAHRLSEDAAAGFGIYPSFGARGEYPASWAGRYHATETSLTVVNVNPVFAWQATKTLALGFGAIAQYFEGDFRNRADVGYLVADELIRQVEENPLAEPIPEDAVAKLAHRFDVDSIMTVDGWAYGFNAGLLWQPNDRLRLGINYQSRTRHVSDGEARRPQTQDPAYRQRLEEAIGDVDVRVAGLLPLPIRIVDPQAAEEGAAQAVGPQGAAGGDIELVTYMPDLATASFYYELNERYAITGGLTYANWSLIDEYRFRYTEPGMVDGEHVERSDLVQPMAWKDTWRFGLGAIFKPTQRWSLRAGAAFDESPVPDAERRSPRGPDSDRIIGTVGASWQWTRNIGIDLGYEYTHFTSTEVDNAEYPAQSFHRIEGDYEGTAQRLGWQVNYTF